MDKAIYILRKAIITGVFLMGSFQIHSAVAISAEPKLRITTFGTSLTAKGGWQSSLAAALSDCIAQEVEISIVAQGGGTTDWAKSAVSEVVAGLPDVLLVELYANDSALNRFISVKESRENVTEILSVIHRDLPETRIIMMAMNPFSGLRNMMRPFVDDYIEAHRSVSMDFGFEFIDHRPYWLSRSPEWLKAVIQDGIHPTKKAAAEIMVPTLVDYIGNVRCREQRSYQ